MTNRYLILPTLFEETHVSWFVFVVRLTDPYGVRERDRILTGMHRHIVGPDDAVVPAALAKLVVARVTYPVPRPAPISLTATVAALATAGSSGETLRRIQACR